MFQDLDPGLDKGSTHKASLAFMALSLPFGMFWSLDRDVLMVQCVLLAFLSPVKGKYKLVHSAMVERVWLA